MNYFYIYLAVLVVALGTSIGSMYGIGRHDNDKQSAGYTASSMFFHVALVAIIVSLVLIMKDSQSYQFCSMNKMFKKPVKDLAKTAVNSPTGSVAVAAISTPI